MSLASLLDDNFTSFSIFLPRQLNLASLLEMLLHHAKQKIINNLPNKETQLALA